jgi:tRNA pseudouridine55 synthase
MARRALGATKGGHTGTLDPFATGLLPLVFGEATKFSRFLIDSTKAYAATLALGRKSETGDPEGVIEVITDDIPELAKIAEVIRSFVGDINQIPPMHSAVHVAGKRLYEYAREGLVVDRKARQVHVFSLEIRGLVGGQLDLAVVCSKGTYIRVLAADIGQALGCGAYLTALRRTAAGAFRLGDAARLEDLDAAGPVEARKCLLPVEAMVASLPRLELDSELGKRFRHGQAIEAGEPREGSFAVFGAGFGFLGVGAFEAERLAPQRLVAEPPKSPDFA